MMEPAMEAIGRIYIPLLRRLKWPKVNLADLTRPFSHVFDIYVSAISAAYVTALLLDHGKERLPDENLEGRDPRW
jgi:hypothetical protein